MTFKLWTEEKILEGVDGNLPVIVFYMTMDGVNIYNCVTEEKCLNDKEFLIDTFNVITKKLVNECFKYELNKDKYMIMTDKEFEKTFTIYE